MNRFWDFMAHRCPAAAELSRSAAIQRGRLRDEGALGEDAEVVDFEEYGWEGPDMDFLDEHDLLIPKPLKKKRAPAPRGNAMPKKAAAKAPPAADPSSETRIPPWQDAAANADAPPDGETPDDEAAIRPLIEDDEPPSVQLPLF